ncbi:MAG: hypothetical protein ACTSU2_02665 [Promethearchaeota archaeon]
MGRTKGDFKRIVLNLPTKTAVILEYLVQIAQVARSKSDLVVQLVEDYVDKRRDILNDNETWRHLMSSLDKQNKDKVDKLLSIMMASGESEEDSEESE